MIDDEDAVHDEVDNDDDDDSTMIIEADGQDDNRNEPAKQGQNEEQGRHIQLCSSDPGRQTPFEELV